MTVCIFVFHLWSELGAIQGERVMQFSVNGLFVHGNEPFGHTRLVVSLLNASLTASCVCVCGSIIDVPPAQSNLLVAPNDVNSLGPRHAGSFASILPPSSMILLLLVVACLCHTKYSAFYCLL